MNKITFPLKLRMKGPQVADLQRVGWGECNEPQPEPARRWEG